jgi:molybdopterin-containing oxidoreductase family iron-sulfur binding subunit
MTADRRKYWKSLTRLDEVEADPHGHAHEAKSVPARSGLTRRRFLEAAGFSLSLTAVSGCQRAPVEVALPLVEQPEGAVPGRNLQYASTCGGCSAGCGLLARVRDGRPIKMEGMPEHPLSHGGLCAVGQALPMGLYDRLRLLHPLAAGTESDWEKIDASIIASLEEIRAAGGAVRVLSPTVTSPTLQSAIDRFIAGFADSRHIMWDEVSSSAVLEAHALTHGRRVLPRYLFENAAMVVSFGADFLGSWISPVEFTAGWRQRRVPTPEHPEMSRHVQFEGRMSLTGSKADRRVRLSPDAYGAVLSHLYLQVASLAGMPVANSSLGVPPTDPQIIHELGEELWSHREAALVVSDSQSVRVQKLVNGVNHLLGGYGHTLDIERPSRQRQGSDADLARLREELDSHQVDALFVMGTDLAHNLPDFSALAESIGRVPLVVICAHRADELASLADFVCPDHHPLESWMDAEPVEGLFTLSQPLLNPLGNTRSAVESLAAWAGQPTTAYEALREHWENDVSPRTDGGGTGQEFWDKSLQTGFVQIQPRTAGSGSFQSESIELMEWEEGAELTLELHAKVGLLESRHAQNPWLQELPDPITKLTWDNCVSLSPQAARERNLTDGDVVRIAAGELSLELPVLIQPGQHDRVLSIPLGYGVSGTDRFAHIGPQWFEARPTVAPGDRVGRNAAPFIESREGALQYVRRGVTVTPTGERHPLATTQEYHSLEVPAHIAPHGAEVREPIEETTLPSFAADPAAGAPDVHHEHLPDLWPRDHAQTGHSWGMVVDLNACTGCSACVIACQSENNVPVVGKDEVLRQREMHWIRIDRYYSGDGDDVDVAHQPMMCQHCEHAPCETVCPVLATVHSQEGLNEQVYNRCVGTRYCANNCPYKVRRFNWFDYPHEDSLQNLLLNPDVTVRTRGVMEKCSLCVQRIEEAKIEANRVGEPLVDGAIQTACQQSCPARAIVFGDRNDPNSAISQAIASPRNFGVLAEFNFRPAVSYQRLVRNREEVDAEPQRTGGAHV